MCMATSTVAGILLPPFLAPKINVCTIFHYLFFTVYLCKWVIASLIMLVLNKFCVKVREAHKVVAVVEVSLLVSLNIVPA